jgi:hypothetical protein
MTGGTTEGAVKYRAIHTMTPAVEVPHWEELDGIRTALYDLRLLGVYENGIGYGNVSMRLTAAGPIPSGAFFISGTSTGAVRTLGIEGYCTVLSADISRSRIVSAGPVRASSESMTHSAVYGSCPRVNCVIHIHNRQIFKGMIDDRCSATPQDAEYGTPEIALAIGGCVNKEGEGDIVLKGHHEGLISYAPSIKAAYNRVLNLYNVYGGSRL